jgi:hypothetical protein
MNWILDNKGKQLLLYLTLNYKMINDVLGLTKEDEAKS